MEEYFRKYILELVREDNIEYENKICSQSETYKIFLEVFRMDKKPEEQLSMLCLNNKNKILGAFEVARGNYNSCILNPKEMIIRCLLCNGNKIILAHNHPSGDSTPSKVDYEMTERMKLACDIIGIQLIDHLVIGENEFSSAIKVVE